MLKNTSSHRLTWDTIPWIVNGTASEAERQAAEEHIRGCADCHEELQFQRELQLHMSSRVAARPSAEGWQRLRTRLNAAVHAPEESGAPEPRRRDRSSWVGWLAAAVVIQAIALGALAVTLSGRAAPSSFSYRTLSSPEAAVSAGTIRVVFAPQMTVAELGTLLARTRLQIVSGPSEAGVWQMAPRSPQSTAQGAMQATLIQLRADPLVRFAAPPVGAP